MAGPLRGIFFDMYGTLFLPPDQTAAWLAWTGACYRALAAAGLREPESGFGRRLAGFWSRPISRQPGLTLFESRIEAFAFEQGLRLSPQALRAVADAACAGWQAVLELDPDAAVALAAAASRACVVLVSNFDHPPHVRAVLSQTGLKRYFRKVVVSSEVGVQKPDPAIMALALADTGLAAAETAYVGDSIVDYQAAVDAGMKAVLIRRPGQVSGDTPRELLHRYGDPEAFLAAAGARGELTVIARLSDILRLLT